MLSPGSFFKRASDGLAPHERLLIAVSGGPDSVALLHLVLPPEDGERERIVVGHVHHGTGEHADRAERFVRELAGELGVECRVERVALDPEVRKAVGFEAAARHERYLALERMGVSAGCGRMLTGHTLDDQAESVLLALMRGAGSGGLAGVRERRGAWRRPLLGVRRADLRTFLEREGMRWLDDPANEDEKYRRVRVRRRLMPLLLEQFGEGAWRNLARSAARISEDHDALEGVALRTLADATRGSTPHWIAVEARNLGEYFASVRARVLLAAWRHARGGHVSEGVQHLTRPQRRRLEALALRGSPGDSMELQGVVVRLTDTALIFDGLAQHPPVFWSLPGSIALPDGTRLEAEAAPAPDVAPVDLSEGELVDADAFGSAAVVRPWREGDRMEPLGRAGHKTKVTRVLDTPVSRRSGPLWVVEDAEARIAWVPGERIAEPVKWTPSTRRVWRLTHIAPEAGLPRG